MGRITTIRRSGKIRRPRARGGCISRKFVERLEKRTLNVERGWSRSRSPGTRKTRFSPGATSSVRRKTRKTNTSKGLMLEKKRRAQKSEERMRGGERR